MKVGDLVYVPNLKRYGRIDQIRNGRITQVRSFNEKTKQFDIIFVAHIVVEAVGLIKQLVILIKEIFQKKAS